jgi:hypothetical protein
MKERKKKNGLGQEGKKKIKLYLALTPTTPVRYEDDHFS